MMQQAQHEAASTASTADNSGLTRQHTQDRKGEAASAMQQARHSKRDAASAMQQAHH
jgi:hypothetical protein